MKVCHGSRSAVMICLPRTGAEPPTGVELQTQLQVNLHENPGRGMMGCLPKVSGLAVLLAAAEYAAVH